MIETTESYVPEGPVGWIFDRIDMARATPEVKMAALLDKALYRHSLRWSKVSPASRRWWRRQRGKHGVVRW